MKNRVKYYPITQGHIFTSWYILYYLKEYTLLDPSNLYSLLINSGKMGGTIPANQGIKICTDYGFIEIEKTSRCFCLTQLAQDNIIELCKEADPNPIALRAILGHIISFHNFQWLIFHDSNPYIFKEALQEQDPEWTALLESAELFNFDEKEVTDWWDKILIKYENYKDEVKKAIGDVGEKITYLHELKRIETEGHLPAKSYVKWASLINDHYGYDILSICGQKFEHISHPKEKIQIEVKSSDAFQPENFRFHVSKNEWNTALENLVTYFFYCWSGVNIENETATYGPYIIPAKDLLDQMPTDNCENIEWIESRCIVNLTKYKS